MGIVISSIMLAKSIKESVHRYYKWFSVAIRHSRDAVPIYVKTAPGLNVHIGAGLINLQGWINLDARKFSHIHIQASDLELSMFSDQSLQQVYLCHVLEHFSYRDVGDILATLFKKLTPGGRIIISLPDFQKMVDVFHECGSEINVIRDALMGGQNYEYNFHKSMFTKNLLSKYLLDAGFNSVEEWAPAKVFGVDLDDWSCRHIPTPKGRRFISLNLLAVKPN